MGSEVMGKLPTSAHKWVSPYGITAGQENIESYKRPVSRTSNPQVVGSIPTGRATYQVF